MPLVTTKEMFEKAKQGKYAIGAFNVNNLEIIQGVVNAASEQNSPVILQMSPSAIKYAGMDYLMAMVKVAVENTDIDIAIHLDHGTDFEICKKCIDAGFTSVMTAGGPSPTRRAWALPPLPTAPPKPATRSVRG